MIDHEKLRELFVASCDLPPEDQKLFLDQNCATSPELRSQLQTLLREDAASGILSDEHMTAGFDLQVHSWPDDSALPTIKGFDIKQLIGKGGMGAVYLAEQKHPKRNVAIKVIRPGVFSTKMARRFDYEATVLAKLQHPGIAAVFSTSTFSDEFGIRPYIVMEFIEGLSLDKHVQENHLNVDECLEIICKICDATQHAHHRGIIHRDIKPGNILVTSDGQPKLLDFGIAKSISRQASDGAPTETIANYPVGTLAYMSPEQIRGSDLDTRSDVYSIGVVAFEMLTGKLPVAVADCSLVEAAERVSLGASKGLGAINSALRGDINTIFMKTIQPNVFDRYQSVEAIAADIVRFKTNQPIAARTPHPLYVMQKFIARNKMVSAALTALAATIVVAAVAIGNYAQKQKHALAEANRQLAIKQEINDFLNRDLLTNSNPLQAGNPELKVVTLIDRAAQAIEEKFDEHPAIESEIRWTIAQSYMGLNQFAKAEPHLAWVLDYLINDTPGNLEKEFEVRDRLAKSLIGQSKFEQANATATQNLEIAEQFPENERQLLIARSTFGIVKMNQDNPSQAESIFREVIENCDSSAPSHTQLRMMTLHNLAKVLHQQRQFDEAILVARQVVEERIQIDGHENSLTGQATYLLGHLLWTRSQQKGVDAAEATKWIKEADSWFDKAIEIHVKSLGERNPKTIKTSYGKGLILLAQNKLDDAELFFEELTSQSKTTFDYQNHYQVVEALNGLGEARLKKKDYVKAALAFEESFEMAIELFGPNHSKTRWPLNKLNYCFRLMKQVEPIQHVVDKWGTQLSLKDLCNLESSLAKAYATNKKFEKALAISKSISERVETSSGSYLFLAAMNRFQMATYLNELGQEKLAEESREIGRQFHAKLKNRFKQK